MAAHGTRALQVTLVSVIVSAIHAFSSGNFYNSPDVEQQACTTRLPGHGAAPQTDPSPFSVSLSDTTYSPGATVTVTLSGGGSASFKGFIMQAIRVDNPGEKVGEFTAVTDTQLNCPNLGGKSISHDGPVEKMSLDFTWTAPDVVVGDVHFIYTVVQVYDTYWVNETSEVITFDATETSTVPQTPIPFVDLTDCGQNKGCFRNPAGCETDCQYIVTWAMNGADLVDFEIQGSMGLSREYIALGMSTDLSMGSDSVTDCIFTGTPGQPVEVQMSYNEGNPKGNSPLTDKYLGLVENSREGYFGDGTLVCRFTRHVSVESSSSPEKDQVFSLDSPYYMFVAKGMVSGGVKQYHGPTKIFSSVQVNVTAPPMEVTPAPTAAPPTGPTQEPLTPIDLGECARTKSCYREPAECTADCQYVVTWAMNGPDMIDFEVEGTMSNDARYIAIGMSKDESMGADSVIDCIYNPAQQPAVQVQMSYNEVGRSNSVLGDPTLGLLADSAEGSYADNKLLCRFTRLVSVDSSSSPDKDKVYDLSSPHNLLVAKGPTASGTKTYHGLTKVVAPGKIDFTSDVVNIGGAITYPLIKAHGILMIFAWMVSASFAILMPRYNKKLWPNKVWCGKPVWFQIHMPLMVCTLLLTVAGFITIFVSVEGFAEYAELPAKAHPIIGIITTALVIINPLMAACRPHPGTPKRPIFNGFHFTVGLCAHACAIACIFIAMYMPKANPPTWGKWVMVAFICWHTLIELLLALHMHCCVHQPEMTSKSYELQEPGSQVPIQPATDHGSRMKTFLLTLHLMGVVAMALALAISIGQA